MDSVAVDHTSNGVVAESEVALAKEICEARKEVSTLERQKEMLNEFLTDITDDYRQRARADMDVTLERYRARATCGQVHRRAGDWDCSSCNTVNFSSRVECFKCKRPKQLKAV